MGNFLKPKICIIGAGSIAPFHIEAALGAGFELYAICARPNSNRARILYEKYNFSRYISDLSEIQYFKPDAISILSNSENLVEIFKKVSILKIPILIEKPVANSIYDYPNDIDLDCDQTLVGYNRRFYSSIQSVKKHLTLAEPIYSNWTISELSNHSDSESYLRIKSIRENVVHILDLLAYLFGPVSKLSTERCFDEIGIKAISTLIKFKSGACATVNISFNLPDLYEGKIATSSAVFTLKPIEQLTQRSEIEIIEPKEESKARIYKTRGPIWNIDKIDLQFKPGFYKQYLELKGLVNNTPRSIGASLRDAKNALTLAEALLDAKYIPEFFQ